MGRRRLKVQHSLWPKARHRQRRQMGAAAVDMPYGCWHSCCLVGLCERIREATTRTECDLRTLNLHRKSVHKSIDKTRKHSEDTRCAFSFMAINVQDSHETIAHRYKRLAL